MPRRTGPIDLVLSRSQVRRVDELAVSRYKMPSLILMENAGRNAAAIIRSEFPEARRVSILCGTGNNGGDGFVIARHLSNAGRLPAVLLVGSRSKLTDDAHTNLAIVEAMGIAIGEWDADFNPATLAAQLEAADLVVDALLGTGFAGEVRSPMAEVIEIVNALPFQDVVAVDVPSGLDCDTGMPCQATIHADLTITFVARKRGFLEESAVPCVGRIKVGDIGTPPELALEVGRLKIED
ncbi:MAG: NAD(P)H-hydrate epimerase [Phycisphaerae bacterium]